MLQVVNVSKHFGPFAAVRDVSFEAHPGEVLGYLGPNGSGKSTTMKMLTGLVTPTSGTIQYRGRDIVDSSLDHRRRIGYVPEEPNLYPYLTGPEYLRLVGGLREIPAPRLDEKIERFLTLFELESDRHAAISNYSKGMKQKVLIAGALLHDPELVILDEPSSGLDVGSTLVLKALIMELARCGKTILYSSHVLELVEQVSSRVVILRQGEIVADGRIERLRELAGQPSLEKVFTELAIKQDVGQTAEALLEAMRL